MRRPRILLLGSITAIVAFAIDTYLPALPAVQRDLGTTTAGTSLTLTALLVGLAVGQLVGGPWSDAVGRRLPVLTGLVGYSGAAALCAVAPSIETVVALRFVQGLLGAFALVTGRAVVRDCWEGVAAARTFARLALVLGAAPVLAPLVGAQVLRVTSWRGVFVLLAAFGLLLAAVSARSLPETLPVERRRSSGLRSTASSFAHLLHDRHYVLVTLAGAVGYGSLFAYLSASSFTLQDLYGLSPQQYALAFGVNGVAFVVASQSGAAVVHRTGARALLVAGGAVQVVAGATLLTGSALGLPAVLAGFFLVTTSVGLVPSNATALALADHADNAGAAAALFGLVSQLSAGLIAPLVSLAGAPGPSTLGAIVVVCGAGCAGLTLLSRAQARVAPPEPELPV